MILIISVIITIFMVIVITKNSVVSNIMLNVIQQNRGLDVLDSIGSFCLPAIIVNHTNN